MATNSSSLFNAALFNAAVFGGAPGPAGPIIQVGQGLLYPALRKAGVTLGPGRTPSPAQLQDAIDEINRLIGSLNCDRLFIYSIDRAEYPLTPPKGSYTIGQPADPLETVDFAAQRPQLIESANILIGSIRYPLTLVTDLQWARIGYQTLPDSIPEILYNDRASPVSTLYLWGQPMSGQILELFVWHQVPYVLAVTDIVTAPLQYVDALVLNLAVRLVTHFPIGPNLPRQVDPNLYQQARESLMRLESINAPQPIADLSGGPGCGCSRYNVYSDQIK
jgi:hypothetical protein